MAKPVICVGSPTFKGLPLLIDPIFDSVRKLLCYRLIHVVASTHFALLKMGRGFLVPDHYVYKVPSKSDMNLASIVWGLTIGIAIFSASKAFRQTWHSWKRGHKWSTYIVLIWSEWIASVTISIISWCFLRGFIRPSFQYFFLTRSFPKYCTIISGNGRD